MTRIRGEWLQAPGTQAVMGALTGAGWQAWFVGGCVRNAALGLPVDDIDIATDARPQEVSRLAGAAGLKVVPTGIDHGTVTVIAGRAHEVTTFRRDVATDGRRATVAYARSMAEDAARRDFTMNALYADALGVVHDPLGEGLRDLHARRVRFIGDPATRIAEDGLRVLRFFRFTAIYGPPGAAPDAAGLAAVTGATGALAPVSAERIGAEMRKLLGAARPEAAVAAMAGARVLARALPLATPGALPALVPLERREGVPPRWLRRLAALDGAQDPVAALRLSRREARALEWIATVRAEGLGPAAAAERFGAEAAEDAALLAAACGAAPLPGDWRARIARGAAAEFPVTAADLIPRHGEGPALGRALRRLHALWVESDFTLDRAALLARDTGD